MYWLYQSNTGCTRVEDTYIIPRSGASFTRMMVEVKNIIANLDKNPDKYRIFFEICTTFFKIALKILEKFRLNFDFFGTSIM